MLEQMPLFPYFGPGDIVPTAALSLSLPDMPRVHFYHYNDIPEVILTMAGDGGLIATGQLYLQQGTHGVTTFLRKPTGAEGKHYQISLIIIRMKAGGPAERGLHPALPEVQRDRVPHGPRRLAGAARTRTIPSSPTSASTPTRSTPTTPSRARCAQVRRRAAAVSRRAHGLAALRAVRRARQPRARRHRSGVERRDGARTQEDAQRVQGRARRRGARTTTFPVGPPGTDPMPHLSRNRVRAAVLSSSARTIRS